jgi:SecD/SecF fusion protein
VLDGKLYCAPNIKDAITGGQATISGQFSNEELTNISNALTSGGFPFIIKVNSVFDTDPKLGAESIANGIYAGIGALLIVVIFMMIYYRLAGVIACFALGVNVVLVLGALAAFEATLTLPGMAGIILTIGMAIDANVLVFERIREELKTGKGLISAIDYGYSKAYSSVLDANITTLFVAIILMNVGTGPIKGFAVTLTIGIITSLFTALFLTRLVFDYITRFTNIQTLKMLQFFKSPKFNFLGKSKVFATISIAFIVLSVALFAVKGKNTLSVDFTGGTLVDFNYTQRVNPQNIEKTLKAEKIDAQITYKTNASNDQKLEILIQSGQNDVSMEKVEQLLNKNYPELKIANGNETRIGGLIGLEFSKTAIWAIVLSFIGIIIYVSFRYEFAYGMAGVVALVHDVIITSGIFVLMGREFSLTVLAALLTIIGYSINDTVVIFDRIRENVGLHPRDSYKDVVNLSINDTLSRTTITSITTLFVVIVLCICGGVAINDFVMVMLIGILVGTYSSICIASPIVAVWHKKIGNK